MRITLSSVFVDNQAKALAFYTGPLGFVKKTDLPAGRFRFLTVVSPDQPDMRQPHPDREFIAGLAALPL